MNRLGHILGTMKKSPTKTKILVFFDGEGSVSKVAKQMGFDVKTLDILPLEHIDLPIDIMDFVPEMLNGWIPDMVWFSPPCETWSIKTAMKGGGNMYWETIKVLGKVIGIQPRTHFDVDKRLKNPEKITAKRIEHTKFLEKSVEIIKTYQKMNSNLVWFIENPATGFMKHYMPRLIKAIANLTTYCKYGSPYRKETVIFSNIELDLKWCPTKHKGHNNTCHHSDSFSQRWDKNKQDSGTIIPQTYLERSMIPDKLCLDILSQAKKAVSV